MSAYNERDVIVAKVERLIEMAAAYGPASVHVFADAPSDGTAALLEPYRDRIDLLVSDRRMGKTHGMNMLVARSDSDLILFTDANVVSDAGAAVTLAGYFADPAIGCVSARLVYSNERESPTSMLGSLYWRMEEAIKQIESDTIGMIGVDGAMFMIRRALHTPPPPHLIDDLYLSLTILASGSRLVSATEVRVFERSAVGATEERLRKRRIACQAMNVHRALWPVLRALPPMKRYGYVSHRLMKWLMPFFLAGGSLCLLLALGLTIGALRALALGAAAVLLVVVGVHFRLRPMSLLSSAILSLAGVGQGVLESLLARRTYTVWDPAASVRAAPLQAGVGAEPDMLPPASLRAEPFEPAG